MESLTEQEKTEALVSAPGTVTVGGRCFLVDKFTVPQVFALYEWATERAAALYNPFREVCDALEGLPVSAADKSAILLKAYAVKAAGEVPADLITKCLRSVEGVAFYLWITTRTNHAEVSFEQLRPLLTEENRLDLYVQLDKASGANLVNKAITDAGFFPPGPPVNHGS